jgi:lipopolysaccharide/colanic/teichoic acid biosynthesis glycosyltransferase
LRGPIDSPESARARTRHDFAYIQNFSLLLDLRIGWLTLRQELRGGTGT